jgi:hypothetical protein
MDIRLWLLYARLKTKRDLIIYLIISFQQYDINSLTIQSYLSIIGDAFVVSVSLAGEPPFLIGGFLEKSPPLSKILITLWFGFILIYVWFEFGE